MKFLLPLSILAVCAALPAQAQTPPDSPPHLDVSGVNLEPLYPAKALAAGEAGSVIVKAYVRENGTVRAINIVSGGNPELDAAAANAVLDWKFVPAMKDGHAVGEWTAVKVNFVPTETQATPASAGVR